MLYGPLNVVHLSDRLMLPLSYFFGASGWNPGCETEHLPVLFLLQ